MVVVVVATLVVEVQVVVEVEVEVEVEVVVEVEAVVEGAEVEVVMVVVATPLATWGAGAATEETSNIQPQANLMVMRTTMLREQRSLAKEEVGQRRKAEAAHRPLLLPSPALVPSPPSRIIPSARRRWRGCSWASQCWPCPPPPWRSASCPPCRRCCSRVGGCKPPPSSSPSARATRGGTPGLSSVLGGFTTFR